MDLKHNNIVIDGVNIHYVAASPRSKTKVPKAKLVFLHGFPESWQTWQQQLEYFSKDYHVIAPDLPGYNLSDKPADTEFYQVPNLVSFIAKFLQAVSGNQKITLVAHDWGGAIAWPLAAFKPYLIEKLVIINAAHPSTFTREMIHNPLQQQKSEYIHQLIADNAVEHLSADNYSYLKDKVLLSDKLGVFDQQALQSHIRAWSQPGAINCMLQYYRAMPQLAPSTEHSSQDGPVTATRDMHIPNIKIDVPTLILWGELDQAFVIETLEGIEEYVPNCQIRRFIGASHWLQRERSPEINYAIDEFILQPIN